jgi:hypothetical protein
MMEWNCLKLRGGQGATSEDNRSIHQKRETSSEGRNGVARSLGGIKGHREGMRLEGLGIMGTSFERREQ